MKLCTCVLGITLMVTTLKKRFTSSLACAGGHFGVFWDLSLHMYISLEDIRSIFSHEILHKFSWLNLIITNANFFLISCRSPQGTFLVYSGAYFGILHPFCENRLICSVKFCTDVLGVPFERHCTIFFLYHDPRGGFREYF